MEISFRKATVEDQAQIWSILEDAIERRKQDGSDQWQDGYPNPAVIQEDIKRGAAYVLADGPEIAGYCAIMINDEPEYANIKGKWLTDGDFVLYHRVAVSTKYLGKGLAKKLLGFIDDFARENGISSIKVDTNHDNAGMLSIFEKQGYVYCGEVEQRGGTRMAFEKVLRD